ncbi:MAG: Rieske (2Fe-2S) protein, partial [Frankiales bacterium]|nr:Rieske (2Fe-2S) protein [Frankiales bacterium]
LRAPVAAEVDRRRVLLGARAVLVAGVATLATGGLTAWLGRAVGGTKKRPSALGAAPRRDPGSSGSPSTSPQPTAGSASASPVSGTVIGRASQVPVGQAGRFTDPKSGDPAWVVHPSAGTFVAFSAVCTHAGCGVQFDAGSMQFVCPCHGGAYDAKSGRVLAGPPPSPLPRIPVRVVNGELRVD